MGCQIFTNKIHTHTHTHTRIYIYTQGDSGGICNTLGNDSMCDSKQEVLINSTIL